MDKLFKQKQSTSDAISSIFKSSDNKSESSRDELPLKTPPSDAEIETLQRWFKIQIENYV